MAPDTTRKEDFTREQCGLPPLDNWESIARELLRWHGHSGTLPDAARYWIVDTVENNPPRDDSAEVTSLQRELAEARAAIEQAVEAMRDYPAYPEDADADRLDAARRRCEMVLAPGPSDAKGENHIADAGQLVPLTDESVRGVLVACGLNDPRCSLIPNEDGTIITGKLRPASEFGVDAERVRELEAELAKSVRVPEGWLLLKPDTVNYHIGWLGKYYAVVDPETMPATTTQSKLDDCEACLDDCNAIVAHLRETLQVERKYADEKRSEAERLRKAIEEHRRIVEGCYGSHSEAGAADSRLWSALTNLSTDLNSGDQLNEPKSADALTPPTAASGEECGAGANAVPQNIPEYMKRGEQSAACPFPGNPPDDSGEWVYSQTQGRWVLKEIYPCASAPAAESEGGESVANLLSVIRDLRKRIGDDAARLAACEERCKELEEGIRSHKFFVTAGVRRGNATNNDLWSLLAPKAEGNGDGD